MVLLIVSGPHENEHFQWDSSQAPERLQLQARRPMTGRMGGKSVGVAIYEKAESPDVHLPPSHVAYRYLYFQIVDNPPIFNAIEPDSDGN